MEDSRASQEYGPAKLSPGELPWRSSVLLPDPDWQGAEETFASLSRSEHLLLTLARCQVARVSIVRASASLREHLTRSPRRSQMPQLDFAESLPTLTETPVLIIRGAAVMDSRLLGWWAEQLGAPYEGTLHAGEARPVVFSTASPLSVVESFDDLASRGGAPRFETPPHHLCLPSGTSGQGRLYLLCTKPRERWITRIFRQAFFPVIAQLARRGVTPSQVTWVSLGVAVLGAAGLAFGGYAGRIAGVLLLAASRGLDVMDGALARLTYVASAEGARLDTAVGRIANVLTALALGWAAFGVRGAWSSGLRAICVLVLGGVLATVASNRADRVPGELRVPTLSRLRRVIDHALHREYTLVLLLFAMADALAGFVWLATAMVYVSFLVDSALLLLASRAQKLGNAPQQGQ